MDPMRLLRSAAFASLTVLLGFFLSGCGGGSGSPALPQQPNPVSQPAQGTPGTAGSAAGGTTTMSIGNADTAAAATIGKFAYHVYPVRAKNAAASVRANAMRPLAVNYPADLTNFSGAVISHATSYDVYINCKSTCWGDPQGFLDRLNNSSYIHILDQYVGSTANHRYAFGGNIAMNVPTYTAYLSQGDLVAIVHAAAQRFGGGYTHVYHLFLPPGVDTCFEETTQCYSPDNPSAFTFCAYHASGTFSDKVGHAVFTVLPYQDVPGCQTYGGPNTSLVDSTASTIAHEYFETLTDPDVGAGWYNITFNQEVADLCTLYDDVDSVDGKQYLLQEQYSNKIHACTNV